MIDVHTHILPGMDDGAPDIKTALSMLQMAVTNQITDVVVTPHIIEGKWFPSWFDIVAASELLRRESSKSGLALSIYPGAEVYMSLGILKSITGPGAYCINNGRYLLVELPALEVPSFADEFFFKLQVRGITPILAHPERHPQLAREPKILQGWINRGIMTQLNGTSLLNTTRKRFQNTGEYLLKNQMVHFIGSDVHDLVSRRSRLLEAAADIRKLVGEIQAQKILFENPKRMLKNEEIAVCPIERLTVSRSQGEIKRWFYRLIG